MFTSLINILLNLILIPTMGINGVSAATLISYVCLVVFSYLVSQRLYPIPLDWKRLGKVMIAFIVTGFLIELSLPNAASPWISLSYKLPALLLYPVLLILLRFIPLKEITAMIRNRNNIFLDLF
jgi:peptidoglycan biosynthesis protein MviN/MurJ (putative lipid II flippase)